VRRGERVAKIIEVITGRKPYVGKDAIECYGHHLQRFMTYEELHEAIKQWLDSTVRHNAPSSGRQRNT